MTTAEARFGDLLAEPLRNGVYKPKEYHGRGAKVINMKELFACERIDDQATDRVHLEPEELARARVKPGDLLFARRSFVLEGAGKCSIIGNPPEDTTFESSMIRARLDTEKAVPHFMYYLFASPVGRAAMAGIATRTAVSGITGKNLQELTLPVPSLPSQRKIAHILAAYDDLIENNDRRIKLLEEMAQRIYREWFVDFRYPGHEEVPLVDSELGPIPKGWMWLPASEALTINPRISVDRDAIRPFVPMTSVSETSMHITPIEQRAGTSGAKFQDGDTLLARITPCLENGKTAYVRGLSNEVASGSTEFIVLRSRRLCPEYTYLLARSDPFRAHAITSMSGATGRQRVRDECFSSFQVAVPAAALLDSFVNQVRPMFDLSYSLLSANIDLRSTRDLLLPRLISGEIDVTDLDIAAAEAAA